MNLLECIDKKIMVKFFIFIGSEFLLKRFVVVKEGFKFRQNVGFGLGVQPALSSSCWSSIYVLFLFYLINLFIYFLFLFYF